MNKFNGMCSLSPEFSLTSTHLLPSLLFFFFHLNEQYCLAQTCFSTSVSLVRGIDRRVLKIRLCGNVICWQIISKFGPVNLTRNESQEPFQQNHSRYCRNHYFEVVVKQRDICSHVKPVIIYILTPL